MAHKALFKIWAMMVLFAMPLVSIGQTPEKQEYVDEEECGCDLYFIDGIQNKADAKLYSLMQCYIQKRKVCFCEICWFIAKTNGFYDISETICKRYKTKGTPHYPLEVMPMDCPYFRLDKEIVSMAKLNYNNIKAEEKVFNI